ncbi:MAG: hypothetical protein VB067_13920 [Christensenellaceae bacterium]|nr:hypothetical protein [Christensenellaceae bacterium]MEA5064783.1 hypothetical protein [Eubacteriales bacterium]MEA5070088.1 hypothetical protein [Christensenellaceae bacterium]
MTRMMSVSARLPPIARATRSVAIARSLYTQQRIVGSGPGAISGGISG